MGVCARQLRESRARSHQDSCGKQARSLSCLPAEPGLQLTYCTIVTGTRAAEAHSQRGQRAQYVRSKHVSRDRKICRAPLWNDAAAHQSCCLRHRFGHFQELMETLRASGHSTQRVTSVVSTTCTQPVYQKRAFVLYPKP